MDPRKAATVTEPSANQAFVQGFAEGRIIAAGMVSLGYHLTFWFEGTKIREKTYLEADAKQMYAALSEHLAHGPGAVAEIAVIDASPPSKDAEQLELPFEEDGDVSR